AVDLQREVARGRAAAARLDAEAERAASDLYALERRTGREQARAGRGHDIGTADSGRLTIREDQHEAREQRRCDKWSDESFHHVMSSFSSLWETERRPCRCWNVHTAAGDRLPHPD